MACSWRGLGKRVAHPVRAGTIRRLSCAALLAVVCLLKRVIPMLVLLAQYLDTRSSTAQYEAQRQPTYQPQVVLSSVTESASSAVSLDKLSGGLCPLGYRVLTISTGSSASIDHLCRFVESALRHDVDPKVIGWGREWVGLMNKPQWLLEVLSAYPSDCVVAFVDADVMFQQDMEYILRAYEQAVGGARVLMGAECACWPFMEWYDRELCLEGYPPSPTKYRYANSGFAMGHVADLLLFFQAQMERVGNVVEEGADDQGPASILYVEQREQLGIALDHYSRIAHQMYEVSNYTADYAGFSWVGEIEPYNNESHKSCAARTHHLRFIEGKYRNVYTHTTPALLHFNGDAKAVVRFHIEEYRRWRSEELGREVFLAENREIREKKVLLDTGARVGLFDLCPAYDLLAGT